MWRVADGDPDTEPFDGAEIFVSVRPPELRDTWSAHRASVRIPRTSATLVRCRGSAWVAPIAAKAV